jgi:dienelactone hydrolase
MAMNRCAAFVLAAALASSGCTQALQLMKDDSAEVLSHLTIAAPNPADPGPFAVKRLFYGSGTDKQRPEYGKLVAIKTKTVDLSPYATIPPAQVKERKKFWGFDLKKAPINGRVWYPDGAGPFALVLIVHGNHNWREFSDPGYAYLGELLASRGFILASVDENFINGGISGENDGRAWLLLKHLEAWKKFNETPDGPFYGRVDMTNVAVMGHSRGGEAAAVAAAFNRLKYYPEDFKQEFNFNFGIKSVVALAPVDGQYKPTGRLTPLENVNYLLMHGSHDEDVSSAMGLRQYERLRFTDGQPWFKSVFFMYRGNHGQWNTVWAGKKSTARSGRYLDLRALIGPEEQRQFAKVVISGFLEATLHQRREYLPMFRDHRTAGQWLPKTMYTTRFQESGYRPLAEFDGDVDLTTGTADGVVLAGDGLSTWNENALPLRWRGTETQNHNAVWLGWNNRLAPDEKADAKAGDKPQTADAVGTPAKAAAMAAGKSAGEAGAAPVGKPEEKLKLGKPASYSISVPDALWSEWGVSERSAVYLSLAATTTKPGPREPKKKVEEEAEAEKKPEGAKAPPKPKPPPKPKEPKKPKEKPDLTPVDFTVEFVDADGCAARLPLSRFGIARRPLEARIFRRGGRDAQRFANIYELVPQTFVMPVADFAESAPEFNPRRLAQIRLVFDRTEAATVVVEQVGLSTPADPAFLASPVR